MQHFLEISALTREEILQLIERAQAFRVPQQELGHHAHYTGQTVAQLFYEHSTRTRVSFSLAAYQLGLSVIDVNLQLSSEQKGETLEDTMRTLVAMGIHLFVIRHHSNGAPAHLARLFPKSHIINAGDGTNAHPSQAMLDMMTILSHKPNLTALKIVMIGNLRHSRVANSFQQICQKLGVGELILVSPDLWQPQVLQYGKQTTHLEEALQQADVVICLRVQKERLLENEQIDMAVYHEHYTLTEAKLALAKSDAIVMHPGPVNRGIEIDSSVVDGPQSVILEQVSNGVFMRMAILERLLQSSLLRGV